MQRRIFISYTRSDAQEAAWISGALNRIGHECWVDQQLEGGEQWWMEVLRAIQWCDLYIPLLSPRYRVSDACAKELSYAAALHRPMIPVHVKGEVGIRGQVPQIAERQWVDVRAMDAGAEQQFLRAVTRSDPAPPLPSCLPEPPTVPISYTTQIREVLARPVLDREAQVWVLDEVERRFERGEEPLDLIELLDELDHHDYYLNALERRRHNLRQAISDSRKPPQPPPPSAATPPPPMGLHANASPGLIQTAGGATKTKSGGGAVVAIVMTVVFLFLMVGCLAVAASLETCDPTIGFC